jgi:hypothetical protein
VADGPLGSPDADALVERAVAAACAVGRRLGCDLAEPRLLSKRGNVLVHLAPQPLVARVATLSALTRHDPAAWMRRELDVSARAAARGGPVLPPSTLVDPGPHRHDGLSVTFWPLLEHSGRVAGPADLGSALARLHRATAGHPGPLPVLVQAREQVSEALDLLSASGGARASLVSSLRAMHLEVLDSLDAHDRLVPSGGPDTVLHGDAHAGNLLDTPDGWRWVDLEETGCGPVEWDLAVASGGHERSPDADETLAAYADESGAETPDEQRLAPFRRARLLEGAVWALSLARFRPDRYAEPASRWVHQALAGSETKRT